MKDIKALKISPFINFHFVALFLTLIGSYLLYTFAYQFEGKFDAFMSIASYITWHNMFEFSAILVSFAVFMVSYYTFNQTLNFRSLVLGNIFLIIGMIDSFHTLTFKGMPEFFVMNNDANRATTFWIAARLVGAVGFALSSLITYNKKLQINKLIFLIPALLLCIAVFYSVTYHPGFIPAMYIEGTGLTPLKINLEYVIIFFLIVAIIKFVHIYIHSKDALIEYLCCALILSVFSEIAFVSYNSVYDIYNYLGHVYKVIAYFIIFRIMFIYNVQKPYVELSAARNEIKNYADNLDKLVVQRTQELQNTTQKLLDDLEYARSIQKALLPSVLPKEEEVSFSARYYPAETVGGDYYNIFKLDESHIALCIGDVSGHGVSAAMLTVFLNQSITATKELDSNKVEIFSPSQVLKNIYESFNRTNFRDDVYIVLFYSVYNFKTRNLTYASAGINVPPLLLSISKEVKEIEVSGFPICKFAEFYKADYEEKTILLQKGDKVVFYTDGLIDAENSEMAKFSEDRLKNTLINNYSQSNNLLADMIIKDVFTFVGDVRLKDDVTLLIMEVT